MSIAGSLSGSVFTLFGGIVIAWGLIPEDRGDIAKALLFAQLLILGFTFAGSDYLVVNKCKESQVRVVVGSVIPLTIIVLGVGYFTKEFIRFHDERIARYAYCCQYSL